MKYARRNCFHEQKHSLRVSMPPQPPKSIPFSYNLPFQTNDGSTIPPPNRRRHWLLDYFRACTAGARVVMSEYLNGSTWSPRTRQAMIASEAHHLGATKRCHTSSFLTGKSLRIQGLTLWRQPHQPHPGTQCSRCGCCLPALTRFTGNRCGGTDGVTITTPASRQAGPLYRSHRKLQPLGAD